MDLDYYEVLEFLKSTGGLNNSVSIAPLIDKLLPNPPSFSEFSTTAMKPIRKILHKLEENGNIIISHIPSPNGSSYVWESAKQIFVELTQKGNSTLEEQKANELTNKVNNSIYEANESAKEVNQSILLTNISVVDTGRSVVETNTTMVDISKKQNTINEKIANNAQSQTDILRGQRFILWASVFVAVCSAFISYLSYRKDASSNPLQQELKTTNQRLDSIRKELFQIRNNLTPLKEAKKTAPKKN